MRPLPPARSYLAKTWSVRGFQFVFEIFVSIINSVWCEKYFDMKDTVMHEWDENVKDHHDGDRIISKFYEYMDDSVTLKFFTNRIGTLFNFVWLNSAMDTLLFARL